MAIKPHFQQDVKISLDNIKPGGLEVRGEAKVVTQENTADKESTTEGQISHKTSRSNQVTHDDSNKISPSPKKDTLDKNW